MENQRKQQIPRHYLDIEEAQNVGSFWKINFEVPVNHNVQSNLHQTGNYTFEGTSYQEAEFHVVPYKNTNITVEVDGKSVIAELAYAIKFLSAKNLEKRKIFLGMMILNSGNSNFNFSAMPRKQIWTISVLFPRIL
jgi:hypothetical protein